MSKSDRILSASLIFSPLVLAILGVVISSRLSRGRWIVHTIVLVAMVLALPTYVYLLRVFEPARFSEPSDAFLPMIYVLILLPTFPLYAIFAFVIRVRPGQTKPPL